MSSLNNITLESSDLRTAIVGLGANQTSGSGAPLENLRAAMDLLSKLGTEQGLNSSFYHTEAVDCAPGTPDFVNAVMAIRLSPSISPQCFLKQLQSIEERFGRERPAMVNGPRPLDLDILYFGLEKIKTQNLEIPHPRATSRRFVIEPLAEIAPDLVLPGESVSVLALLQALPRSPEVRKIES